MCGIAVAIDWPDGEAAVRRLTGGILHRGDITDPIFSPRPNSAMCTRRLRIVDAEHAIQPQLSSDGRIAVAFNGEIYNYLDLRRELQELGVIFKTESDTEVLANALQAWGPAAAKRLGLKWDETVVWRGMPVRNKGGKSLGFVRDAVIDEHDGSLNGLGLTSGIAADMAVGTVDMPARLVKGWNGSAIIVEEEAKRLESDGGAAGVAGRATAVAQDRAGKAGAAAVQGAKTAAAYTKSAVKVAAKSGTAKKVGGFLKSMRDQIVDAAGVPDDDKKK